MRFLIITLISLILMNFIVFATISEISFVEEPYIEILSFEKINFSDYLFYDNISNSFLKFNFITQKDSPIYLLISNDSLNKLNIGELNCSILTIETSNIFNLINENLNETNSFFNISNYFIFNSNLNYSLKEYESINFQKDSYFILNKSICEINNLEINENNLENQDPFCKTHFSITNKDDLINLNSDYLEFSACRGDILKRTIYIKSGSRILAKYTLQKNQSISGKLSILAYEKISIDGLDFFEEILIDRSKKENLDETVLDSENILSEKLLENSLNSNSNDNKEIDTINPITQIILKEKQYFKINNFNENYGNIIFDIETNFETLEGTCYILDKNTQVSSIIDLEKSQKVYELKINNSKFKEEFFENKSLKFLCKYKKKEIKTFYYESFLFNYTIIENSSEEIIQNNFLDLNLRQSSLNQNLDNFEEIITSIQKETFKTQNIEQETLIKTEKNEALEKINENKNEIKTNDESSFTSASQVFKEKSYLFIFAGIILVFIVFIIKW